MTKQKILHITTFQHGGAGIAASRLHNALINEGFDSKFLFLEGGKVTGTHFRFRRSIYLWVLMLRILKKLGMPLTLEQKNDYSIRKQKYNFEIFSFANTAHTKLHEHPLVKEADIIHLHWIANFIDFQTFFSNINKPLVWTLHDMNPFQGGFHYKGDEDRFGKSIEQLNKDQWLLKRDTLRKLPSHMLTIVTPSEWLKNLSQQSEMLGKFPHYCIPNGIDTETFTNTKNTGETKPGRKIKVLFVAESISNYRKGFDMVQEMLSDKSLTETCQFLAVGHAKRSVQTKAVTYTGIIDSEKKMSALYNNADIFLLPSREDNLPNSMIESLCCGTPVIGFALGGLTETITEGKNGYLSEELSAAGLKKALLTAIANLDKFNRAAIAAAAQEKFSSQVQVQVFSRLYKTCLEKESTEKAIAN